ncbi:MAG: hypothetical protein HYU83_01725 [Chloroflexi bacterium]|nr:hypothetical protein [Chloroflexota bacterium]
MTFLKNLTLSLLSFLLFLSLSFFGLAFTLNKTLLNPYFVAAEINRLDISSLAGEIISVQTPGGSPISLETTLVNTIPQLEPLLKEQVNAIIHSTYDYLLDKRQSLNLTLILKDTILSPNFIVSLVDKLDVAPLAGEYLKQQFTGSIPPDMAFLKGYIDKYLDDAITALEPWLKEQVTAAADPIVDYLVGEKQDLSVLISLEPAKKILKDQLWQALLKSPPPELTIIPEAMREPLFDQLYQQLSAQIPSTFKLDEKVLGTQTRAQITQALAMTEETLAQAKQYVGYFQLGYKPLIGFILLLVLGIILIIRQVRQTARYLGVPLLSYGALGYISIFISDYFTRAALPLPGMPSSLNEWLPQFTNNLIAPMETFSLALLISGIVLLIVSFIYKSGQSSD